MRHDLKAFHPSVLSDPAAFKKQLSSGTSFPPPWCNETAYPVEAVTWEGVRYSRQTSFFLSMTVAYSDSHPTQYVVNPCWIRLGSVLFGPWRTGLALP